ncbi:hypothetical protein [Bradyrhizobium sp. BWA-3-5]|uniref:hypothetical protein n=1 Tax=Bradyrhizobium sp. BWA-3-5 TaxID=3080013 RepID=UPI00293E31DB|nr:hypothetical protein [Bradyrhizobium sp. BWA-3-5]WOH63777.1 hypothetical protein RX331_24100 [Bradyrhizobium sp. BWA-3-5]
MLDALAPTSTICSQSPASTTLSGVARERPRRAPVHAKAMSVILTTPDERKHLDA